MGNESNNSDQQPMPISKLKANDDENYRFHVDDVGEND